MIIPIACMNCGNRFSNKWRAYQRRLKARKGNNSNEVSILYVDGSNIPETPEKQTLDELGFRRDCCRKHFLTNIDLIEAL